MCFKIDTWRSYAEFRFTLILRLITYAMEIGAFRLGSMAFNSYMLANLTDTNQNLEIVLKVSTCLNKHSSYRSGRYTSAKRLQCSVVIQWHIEQHFFLKPTKYSYSFFLIFVRRYNFFVYSINVFLLHYASNSISCIFRIIIMHV